MASITLHCPNCPQAYVMSPEQIAKYAGRTITCRKCKQPFSFDAAMDVAAQGQAAAEHDAGAEYAAGAAATATAGGVAGGHTEGAWPEQAHASEAGYAAEGHAHEGDYAAAADHPAEGAYATDAAAPGYGDTYAHAAAEAAPAHPAASGQYFPAPPAPAPTMAYATPLGRKPTTFGDYLAFRAMITPAVIQIIFWVAVAIIILVALVQLVTTLTLFSRVGFFSALVSLGLALAYLIIGPLVVRIYCELLILLFRVHDTLKEIRDAMERRP